uniref:hypothetical protein n=1 Tax=Candidatus Thiosymbion oneisti TaxID=589554 RepID=UPI001C40431E
PLSRRERGHSSQYRWSCYHLYISHYPETLYLLTRNVTIQTLQDLYKHKHPVDLGAPGSGTRPLALRVLSQTKRRIDPSRRNNELDSHGLGYDLRHYMFDVRGRKSFIGGATRAIFISIANNAKLIHELIKELCPLPFNPEGRKSKRHVQNDQKSGGGSDGSWPKDCWRFIPIEAPIEADKETWDEWKKQGIERRKIAALDFKDNLPTSAMNKEDRIPAIGVRALIVTRKDTDALYVKYLMQQLKFAMPAVCDYVKKRALGLFSKMTWSDLVDEEKAYLELHPAAQDFIKENQEYSSKESLCKS